MRQQIKNHRFTLSNILEEDSIIKIAESASWKFWTIFTNFKSSSAGLIGIIIIKLMKLIADTFIHGYVQLSSMTPQLKNIPLDEPRHADAETTGNHKTA